MWKREILGQVLSSGNTRTLKLDGPPGRCIRYFFRRAVELFNFYGPILHSHSVPLSSTRSKAGRNDDSDL